MTRFRLVRNDLAAEAVAASRSSREPEESMMEKQQSSNASAVNGNATTGLRLPIKMVSTNTRGRDFK